MTDTFSPLRDFVAAMTRLVGRTQDEATLLSDGQVHLASLLANDRWLPEAWAAPTRATRSVAEKLRSRATGR